MFGIKKAALKLVGKAKNGSGYQLFEDKEAGALTRFWLYNAGFKDGIVNQRLAYQLSARDQLDMSSRTGFVQQFEGVDDTAHLISACLEFDESHGAVSDDTRMFLARMLASYAVREGAWEQSAGFDQNAGLHIVVIDQSFPGDMAKLMAVVVSDHPEILTFEDIDHVVVSACAG
jgi:hypothetical protein